MKRILFALVLLVCLVGQSTSAEANNPTIIQPTDMQPSGVVVVSAPSGPDVATTSTTYVEIPRMKTRIVTAEPGDLLVTFCAEAELVGGGGPLYVQITDNGVAFAPSGVIFAAGTGVHTHCFTFVENNAPAGFHVIHANWMVTGAVTGYMGDRTMTITFARPDAEELRLVGAGFFNSSGRTVSNTWSDVTSLARTLDTAYTSDLAITFSAEAYAIGASRLFVRALVDNVVISPSDAIIAASDLIGARAHTFVANNIPPGSHSVHIEVTCDTAAQCYYSSRSLAVVSIAQGDRRHAGGAFLAAPSGTTPYSGTSWSDMPNARLANIFVPTDSDLAVEFTASMAGDGGSSLHVRALVDGSPVEPSDVLFRTGSGMGCNSFTFIVHNLTRGSHTIQMQWLTNGITSYLDDHTTAAWAYASQHPLLMIGLESYQNGSTYGGFFASSVVDGPQGGSRFFKPYVRDRLFNADPSVAGYFRENSYNRFFLVDGGVKGPYLKQYDEATYRARPNCFEEMQLEALQKADSDNFDFALYDRNGDGSVTPNELVTIVVLYQNESLHASSGFVRTISNYVTNDGVTLVNTDFPHVYLQDFNQPHQIGLISHELAHIYIQAGDMYEDAGTDPSAPGPFSLMDQHNTHPDLDPWHKLHHGQWFNSHVINQDGYELVTQVEQQPSIYKLADPSSHLGEYFLVENRQHTGYDSGLPDTGLAIWHINDNAADPYRDGVMIESASGTSNYTTYMFDGAGSLWGKDWWWGSIGSNSRWLDASDSHIGVWAIPPSGSDMLVYFDVPGPGILVDIQPMEALVFTGQSLSFPVRLVNTGSSPDTFTLTSSLPGGWGTWSQNPVTLTSYQERIVSLSVHPPAGAPTGQVWFSVTATSNTQVGVTTTHPQNVVLQVKKGIFIPLVKK